MAQLSFPIALRELRVDVRVNLSAPELAVLVAGRRPAPVSAVGRAVLDTGSNVTGVSAAIIQQLALTSHASNKTSGVGGPVPVRLFRVSLSVFDAAQPHQPWFVQPDVEVMELPSHVSADVLIGMDVLLQCRLTVDGPAGTFTIDY